MTNYIKAKNTDIIASPESWIEGEAVRQLNSTSSLPGMEKAVGLPDLHPGKGHPIGAAFLTRDIIYPFLIGNDIGCGMSLFKTSLKKRKIKRDKWVKKLNGLELPWEEDFSYLLQKFQLNESGPHHAMGTIGGGNHFAELLGMEKLFEKEQTSKLPPEKDHLYLLVHSGSRGLGEKILRNHTDSFGAKGLKAGSAEAKEYLDAHDYAVRWARCNRFAVAQRFLSMLGSSMEPVLCQPHNSIVKYGDHPFWLHRKGAAPSGAGPVIIPGSRGSLSYLVNPVGNQERNLQSLAHGAGRKWNRASALSRFKTADSSKALVQTKLGSSVICEDRKLLHEEAPGAYKNIRQVIEDLESADLIKTIATFRPVITYKVRRCQ